MILMDVLKSTDDLTEIKSSLMLIDGSTMDVLVEFSLGC